MARPTIAGRYELVDKLGAGAAGEVYRVVDLADRSEKALKILQPKGVADAGAVARAFHREFEALTRIRHPHLVRVHDFGSSPSPWGSGDVPWFCMDLVAGRPIDAALSRPVDWHVLARVADAVLDALGELHARGLVHGDVTAANILVGADPEHDPPPVWLMDLGLASRMGRADEGVVRGTPATIAPETLRGAEVDGRADLYSLGCVLYRVITGQDPFLAASPWEVLRAHLTTPPTPPRDLEPDLPPSLQEIVLRLMAKAPAERPATAQEVRRWLSPLSGRAVEQALPLRSALAPVLAGRRRENDLFAESLAQLSGGRGEVLIVAGAPGTGRTRLLEEFRIAARLAGARSVLAGAADAPRRPLGLADALASGLEAQVGHPARPGQPARAERLGWLASEAPAVLLVDDAEAADAASVEVLRALAARIGDGSLASLLVLGYSNDDGGTGDLRADLLETRSARLLRLKALDAAAVREMAASMLGQATLPPGWGEALHARTGGIPLLVEELVKEAVRAGRFGPGAAVPQDPERALAEIEPVADRTRDWLERRWSDLPPGCRAMLAALAVTGGEPLSFAEMVRLDPHAGVDAAAADALLESRLVRRVRTAGGELGLALTAPALAGLVVERTPRPELRTLHRRRAEVLAGLAGAEAQRGRHLLAAGEPAAAVELLGEAAARSFEGGLARETIRLVDEALAAGAVLPPPRREGRLRRLRASALAAAGHTADAEAEFVRALAAARGERDPQELAESLRISGRFRGERGDQAQGLADLEEALALLDDLGDVAGGARVLLDLGRLLERLGRADDAEARLASALNQARRSGRPDLEADALVGLGEIAARRGRAEQAGELFRSAEAAAGGAPAALRSAARRGKVLALEAAGRLDDALEGAARLLDEAVRADHVEGQAEALALLGRLHARLGRRGAALKSLEQAVAARQRLGQEALAAELVAAQAVLLLERGQPRVARARAIDAEALARRSGSAPALSSANAALARVAAALGNVSDAEKHLPAGGALNASPLARTERALWLGAAHLNAAQAGSARGVLQESCFLARRSGLPELEREGLLLLAEAYAQLDDEDRTQLALRRVRQACETAAAPEVLARAALLSAERELLRPGGDLAHAREQAQSAADELTARERGDLAWRAWAALAEAAQRSGDAAGAASAAAEARRRIDAWLAALPESDRERWRPRLRAHASLERIEAPEKAAEPSGAGSAEIAELERLLEINRALNSARDFRAVLQTLLDTAVELTGAERGFVLLEEGGRTVVELARGEGGADLAGEDREMSRGVARQVIETRQPLLAHDARSDERLSASRSVHALQLQSILAMPLAPRGELAGAIVLDSRRTAGMFLPRHQQLLARLADQAGIALSNARLVDELRRQAEEIRRLNERLREEIEQQRIEILEKQSHLEVRFRYESLIGAAPAMQKVYRSLDKIVPTEIPVLITGESGTGKDLVARVLHYSGPRREQRFVTVNCAALTDTLLESELFGHRRGAFTGADRDRKGLFEQADGGTLFLDEIGEMPLHLQPKLLRALQFGEVRRVGEDTPRHVNVRIVAATNRELGEAVRDGRFREDLFYRLDVARIHLCALRERLEDIGLLIEHFLEQAAVRSDRPRKRIEPAAQRLFLRHSWPGNVRELENEVLKLATFTEGEVITEVDVLENATFLARGEARGEPGTPGETAATGGVTTLEHAEVEQIRHALQASGGNRTRAAEMLGIDRSTLYRKLRRLGEP
ncbi:MAG: sigma 54-interacting transcriptional regulator [Acidobacteria bacterium]|nr:sigma 54-interacting transcriptional regulator [Acidobacteriota bacterium]